MIPGIQPAQARAAIAAAALMAVMASTAGCNLPGTVTVKPTATPTPKASAAPVARPAVLKGAYETTKFRVQKVRNFYFKDKTTGKLVDPRIAETRGETVTLEAGDSEELVYEKGKLRYAFFGQEARSVNEQPFVAERELPRGDYQAIEDGLDADNFWGLDKQNWDSKTRFPFYYLLYVVGDAGYEASFTPNLNKLRKAGPLLDAHINQMGGSAKLPPGFKMMTFSQQASDGNVRTTVAIVTPDGNGDPVEEPFNLRSAEVDVGSGKQEALLGPTENAFTYDWPAGGRQIKLIGVKLTSEDGKTIYETVLPIRTQK